MAPEVPKPPKTLAVTSSSFEHGKPVPKKYTCEGTEVSPPLSISGVPAGARTLAIIVDDPDAPRRTWIHWLVWNLPADRTEIPEAANVAQLGGKQGRTTGGKVGYEGPCPPGGTHRYFFKVYALANRFALPDGSEFQDLARVMEGRVLAWGELMGTYSR